MVAGILLLMLLVPIHAQDLHVRLVGDLMLGSSFPEGYLPPQENADILAALRPSLSVADITAGNLEGVFCDDAESDKCAEDPEHCYAFKMPSHFSHHLERAGFDFVSLANNHSNDFGDSCLTHTENLLDSLGIAWSGRPGTIGYQVHDSLRVAFLAFHSGSQVNSSLHLQAVRTLIRNAVSQAEIVIVSVHGGGEGTDALHLPDSAEFYLGEPRGHLRAFAHAAVDAGADLVFGHGPHVARAIEVYRDRLIAYSLGNFATYGRFNLSGERQYGAILEVRLAPNGMFREGRIHGTVQRGWGVPEHDPENQFAQLVSALTLADIEDPGILIHLDGTIQAIRP